MLSNMETFFTILLIVAFVAIAGMAGLILKNLYAGQQ
jgi:hypothetical protein